MVANYKPIGGAAVSADSALDRGPVLLLPVIKDGGRDPFCYSYRGALSFFFPKKLYNLRRPSVGRSFSFPEDVVRRDASTLTDGGERSKSMNYVRIQSLNSVKVEIGYAPEFNGLTKLGRKDIIPPAPEIPCPLRLVQRNVMVPLGLQKK